MLARPCWQMASLFFLAAIIDCLDRAMLSVAAPAVSRDLHLGPGAPGLMAASSGRRGFWIARATEQSAQHPRIRVAEQTEIAGDPPLGAKESARALASGSAARPALAGE
ncbi:MAG TPA: hypothetical protein VMA37_15610 [Acetobacteraceae bacterium]|nr:hypothetical protein [Acetobacteraceae bacterium]